MINSIRPASCDTPVRMCHLCHTIGSVETAMPLSDDDDNDHVQVAPRRRVPLTTASQDDSGLVVKGISVIW